MRSGGSPCSAAERAARLRAGVVAAARRSDRGPDRCVARRERARGGAVAARRPRLRARRPPPRRRGRAPASLRGGLAGGRRRSLRPSGPRRPSCRWTCESAPRPASAAAGPGAAGPDRGAGRHRARAACTPGPGCSRDAGRVSRRPALRARRARSPARRRGSPAAAAAIVTPVSAEWTSAEPVAVESASAAVRRRWRSRSRTPRRCSRRCSRVPARTRWARTRAAAEPQHGRPSVSVVRAGGSPPSPSQPRGRPRAVESRGSPAGPATSRAEHVRSCSRRCPAAAEGAEVDDAPLPAGSGGSGLAELVRRWEVSHGTRPRRRPGRRPDRDRPRRGRRHRGGAAPWHGPSSGCSPPSSAAAGSRWTSGEHPAPGRRADDRRPRAQRRRSGARVAADRPLAGRLARPFSVPPGTAQPVPRRRARRRGGGEARLRRRPGAGARGNGQRGRACALGPRSWRGSRRPPRSRPPASAARTSGSRPRTSSTISSRAPAAPPARCRRRPLSRRTTWTSGEARGRTSASWRA